MASKETCRTELRAAVRHLSERGLYSAAKWYQSQPPQKPIFQFASETSTLAQNPSLFLLIIEIYGFKS